MNLIIKNYRRVVHGIRELFARVKCLYNRQIIERM